MFYGTYFTYAGTSSSSYGLTIAEFDIGEVDEVLSFSPTFTADKPAKSPRFFYGRMAVEEPPTFEMTAIRDFEISANVRNNIHKWLAFQKRFQDLKIHGSPLEDYTFHAVFTDVSDIYVNGRMYGVKVTGYLDSPYAYLSSVVVNVSGNQSTQTVTINNKSNIGDYVYPTVKIVNAGTLSSGKNMTWVNGADSASRFTEISGATSGSDITINGEIREITSTVPSEGFQQFNRVWPRLMDGNNYITVGLPVGSSMVITVPSYSLIGR